MYTYVYGKILEKSELDYWIEILFGEYSKIEDFRN